MIVIFDCLFSNGEIRKCESEIPIMYIGVDAFVIVGDTDKKDFELARVIGITTTTLENKAQYNIEPNKIIQLVEIGSEK